ncbi:MAG: hypothetical protein IKN38_01890 [Clostridia bacterium]|nr:hypothetical protein [Clostridia bacterium]
MKKITLRSVCIALVVLMAMSALLISGCGKKSEDGKSTDAATEAPKDPETDKVTEDTASSNERYPDTSEETLDDPGNSADPATRPSGDNSGKTDNGNSDGGVASLDEAETVDERMKASVEPGEGLTLYQIKYINDNLYTEGGNNYNWYEFYNACVMREITLKGNEAALKYAKGMLAYFEAEGLTDETSQAYTIIDVASGY